MLILYKNKPNSISINPSRPSSSHPNQHNLALDTRPVKSQSSRAHSNFPVQRMNNTVSRASNDMFSSYKGLRAQMFREFEDFQSGFMRQVSSMFGDLGFGGMGSYTPVVRSQGTAKMISKTYVYSTKIDGNGRMYAEKYFSNDVALRGSDGTTMLERQQAYHNTGNNLQRIAEERRINHQGKKLTQQRIKGQDTIAKQIQYYNMEENEVDQFDQNWDFQSRKLGFYGGSQKRVAHDPQDVPFIPSSTRHRNEPDRQRRYFDFGHLDQDVQPVSRVRNSRNEDRPINVNNPQGHARVRRNDIQPVQPGRAIALPRNEVQNQNDAPVRARPVNSRQGQRQPREQNRVVENVGHEQVHERPVEHHHVHHEPAPRVGTAIARRNNEAGLRGDGNFKNKHIPTAMPEAG